MLIYFYSKINIIIIIYSYKIGNRLADVGHVNPVIEIAESNSAVSIEMNSKKSTNHVAAASSPTKPAEHEEEVIIKHEFNSFFFFFLKNQGRHSIRRRRKRYNK